VKSRPGSDAIEFCGAADGSAGPARKTLDTLVRLEVACPVALLAYSRSVDSVQAELFLEHARKYLVRVDGLVGMVDLERLRMNPVHRDVKMLVVLLAVAHGDVLMFLQARRPQGPGNDVSELGGGQASVHWMERDDQVVRLASLRPLIAVLQQLHDVDGKLRVLATIEAREIPGHVPGAALLALAPKHVWDEPR